MFRQVFKGFIIGGAMMVPGLSGGSMAMILGVYERLINAVPNLFVKGKRKDAFVFLFLFSILALLGIVLVARPLEMLITKFPVVSMYFFLGAVLGTIPMVIRKAGREAEKPWDWKGILFLILGAVIVLSVGFLPSGLFAPSGSFSFGDIMIEFVGGFLVSVGFVLPGISLSYLLLVLGLYEPILRALSNFQFLSLFPFGFGALFGILAFTKFLQWAMAKHPKGTFMMILGFLIGSIKDIYPGVPQGNLQIFISLVLLIAGYTLIWTLSMIEERDSEEAEEKAQRENEVMKPVKKQKKGSKKK